METWLPIPDYEGWYEVSDMGNVRSVTREVTQVSRKGKLYTRTMKSKQIAGYVGSGGRYRFVNLANVTCTPFSVHALVLKTFKGNPPNGHEGCHADGDSLNNKLGNLRWATHVENEQDKKIHGTVPKGENHACAILTNAQVTQIKSDLAAYTGRPYGKYIAIGKLHSLPSHYVGAIHRGERWAHI